MMSAIYHNHSHRHHHSSRARAHSLPSHSHRRRPVGSSHRARSVSHSKSYHHHRRHHQPRVETSASRRRREYHRELHHEFGAVVPLKEFKFAKGTRRNYNRGMRQFLDWQQVHYPNGLPGYSGFAAIDRLLVAFFTSRSRDVGPATGNATIAAFKHIHPDAIGQLPLADQAMAGWRAKTPSTQHPPLTYPLACAIAHAFASNGQTDEAVGVLLAFDCLLRISELAGLTFGDIIDHSRIDPALPERTQIVLDATKRGRRQSVYILSPHVITLLRELILEPMHRSRRRNEFIHDQPLFAFTKDQFRTRFIRMCGKLGLSRAYVPHSLRHGGATKLFMSNWPVEDIKHRGRWALLTTCERYVQDGEAAIGSIKAPSDVARTGFRVSKDIHRHILAAVDAAAASSSAAGQLH
jgi:integrase